MKNCTYECTKCGNTFELPDYGKTMVVLCHATGKKAIMVKTRPAKVNVAPKLKLVN